MKSQTGQAKRRIHLLTEAVSDIEIAVERIVPIIEHFHDIARAQEIIGVLNIEGLPTEWGQELNENLQGLRAAVCSGNENVAIEKVKVISKLCQEMKAYYKIAEDSHGKAESS